jgi:hypothetical protein
MHDDVVFLSTVSQSWDDFTIRTHTLRVIVYIMVVAMKGGLETNDGALVNLSKEL